MTDPSKETMAAALRLAEAYDYAQAPRGSSKRETRLEDAHMAYRATLPKPLRTRAEVDGEIATATRAHVDRVNGLSKAQRDAADFQFAWEKIKLLCAEPTAPEPAHDQWTAKCGCRCVQADPGRCTGCHLCSFLIPNPHIAPEPAPEPAAAPSIQAQVRDDLVQRERLGKQHYGTALYPHNGRNALQDAYEEALDMACYLKQALVEKAEPAPEGKADECNCDPRLIACNPSCHVHGSPNPLTDHDADAREERDCNCDQVLGLQKRLRHIRELSINYECGGEASALVAIRNCIEFGEP